MFNPDIKAIIVRMCSHPSAENAGSAPKRPGFISGQVRICFLSKKKMGICSRARKKKKQKTSAASATGGVESQPSLKESCNSLTAHILGVERDRGNHHTQV